MTRQPRDIASPDDTAFGPVADFVLGQDVEIPDAALRHAATLLIDTPGVAAGATRLEAGRIARDFAADFHGANDPANAAHMLFDGRHPGLTGIEALRAMVVAYEVAARAGMALHATARDYHTSGACIRAMS